MNAYAAADTTQAVGLGSVLFQGVMFLVGAVLIFWLYFLPFIHAKRVRHPNEQAIGILNLFFGWTVLGWFAALIWSATRSERPPLRVCTRCGHQLSHGVFCPSCGEKAPALSP